MKILELLTEARDSLVGRQVAVKFEPADETEEKWWLGEITLDNGKIVDVDYYNTKFNDKDYGFRFDRKYFIKPSKFHAKSFALVKPGTKKSAKGLDSIDDIRIDYVKSENPVSTNPPKPTKAPAKKAEPKTKPPEEPSGKKFKPSAAQLRDLEFYAEDGDRIVADGKTIYAGFGNRSGLHSYLQTALNDTFKKWPNAKKKLEAGEFSKIEVLTFRNIDRDRGRWIVIETYKAPK